MKYLALILLLMGACFAQDVPDAPSAAKRDNPWKPDASFYVTTGLHIAATEVDVRFVQNCERLATCVEANPGKDHWAHRWPEIALGAGVTYGCQVMLTGHKYWRRLFCPLPVLAWSTYQVIDGTRIHPNPRKF